MNIYPISIFTQSYLQLVDHIDLSNHFLELSQGGYEAIHQPIGTMQEPYMKLIET